jgi:hypothetical protein
MTRAIENLELNEKLLTFMDKKNDWDQKENI